MRSPSFTIAAVSGTNPNWRYTGTAHTADGQDLQVTTPIGSASQLVAWFRSQGLALTPAAVGSEWPCIDDGELNVRPLIEEFPEIADCSEIA